MRHIQLREDNDQFLHMYIITIDNKTEHMQSQPLDGVKITPGGYLNNSRQLWACCCEMWTVQTSSQVTLSVDFRRIPAAALEILVWRK